MLYTKEKLDGLVLDIEFLLISVVQGVALTALAVAASPIIINLQWEYFPYIITGFLFVLIFWSQAIIHSMSFIEWPIDIFHNFFYFLASFTEVILFNTIANPFRWFVVTAAFFIVAGSLYFVDLQMIKRKEKQFLQNAQTKKLYAHMLDRQMFEFFVIVPSGFVANVVCALLIYYFNKQFITNHWHILVAALQTAVTIFLVANTLKSFKKRSRLISENAKI